MTDRHTHIFDGQDEALAAEFDRLRSVPGQWWTSGGLVGEDRVTSLDERRQERASDLRQ
jgi:hypothetical protein